MNRKAETRPEAAERPLHGEAHIPKDYGPDDMRQGEVVLRTKRQRVVFIGTLVAGLAILVIASVAAVT